MIPGKVLSLTDIVAALKRRMWLLVIPPLVGLFAALVVSAGLPNSYQSEVLVAIVPQRVPDAFVKSTVTLRTEERLDAIAVQVLSRDLLEQMVRDFDLYPLEREELPMDEVVQKMRGAIVVAPERARQGPRGPEPLHAFRLRYNYGDAKIVADITQRLASAFVDQNARDRNALALATNEFLEAQLVEARQRLEAQEAKLEVFRERHGNALPTQLQANMQGTQNTQLQIQALVESAARDRDRRLMLQRLITEVESDPGIAPVVSAAPSAAGANASPSATVTQQLALARQSLGQLEVKFKPEHPDVVRAKRQIRDLEARAVVEAASNSTPGGNLAPATSREELARRDRLRDMRAEVESLERQLQFKESEEQRLRATAAEYQRRIDAVPGAEAEWSQLTRDYEATKTLYEDLLSKSEQSNTALDLERLQIGEQFKIVDAARVPDRPVNSVRLQVNAAGLGLGLFVGFAIAALLEFRDTTLRTETDVMEFLSLPVLTVVPFVETTGERRARGKRHRMMFGMASATAIVLCYTFWSMRLWNYFV